ncbi:Uncharacterised protein [Sphingobacterium spiritivorum]|uniref:Uncharacterized protein n=1 Tax=Sphingobacterium spiritivorum TaxID=258 RepID=A0A380BKQ0_SPHSI|nr:hypothetical protein [Sphingobacterium spiritivorum]SUJ02409.1 Uncharacterised protein [Sphingobacterium spiritivorum]
MMRKYIILFITLLSFFKALGQSSIENNEIILPSPTAYSFVKNIENPTNLYNGLVDISENLFSVQSGVLKINISLNYNTSGIKPSEIPGWVGLGFNLNAGGVISRIVKDLPDDAQNGYLRKYEEIEVQMNKAMPDDEFLKSIKAGQIDSKQDVFIYNFNGYNGKFVFDENGSISILNGDNLKIIYDIGYRIDQFKVIDDKGVTYTFSSSEKTFFKKGEIDDFFISTWYLSKIENRNGDRITFNYTIPGNNYRFKGSLLFRK